jgi:hypothetical protein
MSVCYGTSGKLHTSKLWSWSLSHHYLCVNILALAEKTLNLFPAVEMFLLAVRRDYIEG